MQYRSLGHSGLKVSTITFGAMTFGGTGFFTKAGTTGIDDAAVCWMSPSTAA